jgi:hypothetical protein
MRAQCRVAQRAFARGGDEVKDSRIQALKNSRMQATTGKVD